MTWIVILAVGLGSYLFRVGPQLLFERTSLSANGDQLIRHAGTAALTALIVVSTKQSATGNALVPTVLAVAVAGVARGSRGFDAPAARVRRSRLRWLSTIVIGLVTQ